MDKIVEITRRGGVATVKLQSGDVLRVPSAVFLERRLHGGQEIDGEAYREFARRRSYPYALEAAVKYLSLRERSAGEVRARLRRVFFEEAVIDRVMETLTSHGLVQDSRFAGEWAWNRARKYGKNRIAQELRRKGVSPADVRNALDEIPEEEEYQQALIQAGKLARKYQQDPLKIQQALVRRGYAWPLARRVAEEAVRTQAE